MEHDVKRTMIESSVRRALGKIDAAPQRSVRNLVDLALASSRSDFQRSFFSRIQRLLQSDDESVYFDLARRVVSEVDTDRLITFGMNLGYEGCTKGAATVRANEARLGFNIPWMIGASLPEADPESVRALIEEARGIGAHVFSLYTHGRIGEALGIAAQFDDCAFFLFTPASAVTAEVASRASAVPQAVISIRYDAGACYAASLLRSMRLPFGAHLSYPRPAEDPDEPQLALSRILALNPHFVILTPRRGCPDGLIGTVYQRVLAIREEQRYPAIVMDGYSDRLSVDRAISAEPCAVDFDSSGAPLLFGADPRTIEAASACNVYTDGLESVLARLFPRRDSGSTSLDIQRRDLIRQLVR